MAKLQIDTSPMLAEEEQAWNALDRKLNGSQAVITEVVYDKPVPPDVRKAAEASQGSGAKPKPEDLIPRG